MMSAMQNRYVRGANLVLWNDHSFSCNPRTLNVHRVTQSWTGATAAFSPLPRTGRGVGGEGSFSDYPHPVSKIEPATAAMMAAAFSAAVPTTYCAPRARFPVDNLPAQLNV